jgi:hypothetical protein
MSLNFSMICCTCRHSRESGNLGPHGRSSWSLNLAFALRHAHSSQICSNGGKASPSPPLGAERVGVRWGDSERSPSPTSPSHAYGVGPFLSPLKGGEGFLTSPAGVSDPLLSY